MHCTTTYWPSPSPYMSPPTLLPSLPLSSPSLPLPLHPLPAPVRVRAAPDQPVQLHGCQAAGRQLCGQVLPPLPLAGGAGAGLLVRPAGRRGLSGEGRGRTVCLGGEGRVSLMLDRLGTYEREGNEKMAVNWTRASNLQIYK